jgi:mono/diheme cytochrome c family protein
LIIPALHTKIEADLRGQFGGPGIVHLSTFNFSRRAILIISIALILGIAVLGLQPKTLAQNGPATQDAGQAAAAPAPPPQPKPAVELPDGDGKAIATEYCQDCHKLTNLTKARKNPDDWHDTVQTMMDRGARLPQEKFDTLVQYLAKNFGPQPAAPAADTPPAAAASLDSTAATASQPPKPAVELPDGDGKAIATEYCQDCHKLTNLTKARKNPDDWHDTVQTMMDRGARLPQEKFDTLVQYLAKNFGPQPAVPAAGVGSPEASPAGSSPSNR